MKRLEELKEYHNIYINRELQRVELLDTLHGDYCHGHGAPTSYYRGKANYQVFLGSGLPVSKGSGHYDDQLYISFEALDAMDDAQWDELTEMLSALSGYPVLDDELLSRLEHEAIIEHLESDGIDDLTAEIERRETDIPFCMPDLSAADCYNLLQALNIEIGSDCGHALIYFNVKKAADGLLPRWNDYRLLNGVDGDVFLLNDRTEIDFIRGLIGDQHIQAEVNPCD